MKYETDLTSTSLTPEGLQRDVRLKTLEGQIIWTAPVNLNEGQELSQEGLKEILRQDLQDELNYLRYEMNRLEELLNEI